MVSVNWDNFEAKFPDKEYKFQEFCYLLFCREFNQPYGIFEFINQAAIENEPITINQRVIGFQAKYYNDTLTNRKSKIIESLDDAHNKYPDLNEYYFYSNQSFGQSSSAKKDIEDHASNLGIKITWRIFSYFKSEDVCIKNADISEYFFTPDNSNISNLLNFKNHTVQLFSNINFFIEKNGNQIHIEYSNELKLLQSSNSKVFVIHGDGGCGKTALLKEFISNNSDKTFLGIKALEFGQFHTTEEALFNCSKEFFIEIYKNVQNKYFIIDSAEKLLDIPNSSVYSDLIQFLNKNEWNIIFTTRNNYFEALLSELEYSHNLNPTAVNIPLINEPKLKLLLAKYDINLPADSKLISLIRNPFYLSQYVRLYSTSSKNLNLKEFKRIVWNSFVRVENDLISLAVNKANNGCFYLNLLIPKEQINRLCDEKIITKESDNYFISHDIFEEWALEKYIQQQFSKAISYSQFLLDIGNSLPMRRAYRDWLAVCMETDKTISSQVLDYIQENIENLSLAEDTLIGILLSDNAEVLFEVLEDCLLTDNFENLLYLQRLLRVACKNIDEYWLNTLNLSHSVHNIESFFTCPKGSGWNAFINFVINHISKIKLENINLFFSIFLDWTNKFKNGKETRNIALQSLNYLKWIQEQDYKWQYHDFLNEVYQIISNSAEEVKDELSTLFKEIINNNWKNRNDNYSEFISEILSDIKYSKIWIELPDETLSLMKLFWTAENKKKNVYSYYSIDKDEEYGLNNSRDFKIYTPSAMHTPILVMLVNSYNKTIDFLISFFNQCTERYAQNHPSNVYKVSVEINGKTKYQYANGELWCMFRGSTGTTPYILQSILMALEKYFIDNICKLDIKTIKERLIYILENSETVALTGVVSSIVLSNYKHLYSVAKFLLIKDFITYDFLRCHRESEAKTLYSIGNYGSDTHFAKERLDTCKQDFRNKSLQEIFLEYQVCQFPHEDEDIVKERQVEIWSRIDNFYNDLPKEEDQSDDDKNWRFRLASLDYRKMQWKKEFINDKECYSLNPTIAPELKKYKEENEKKFDEEMPHIELSNWIHYVWDNDNRHQSYRYSKNPSIVIQELKELENQLKQNENNNSFLIMNYSIFPKATACIMRDFVSSLSEEEINYCKNIVLEYSKNPMSDNYHFQYGDGVLECISVLPNLMQLDLQIEDYNQIKILLLTNLILNSNSERNYKNDLLKAIRNNLSREELLSLIEIYLLLIHDWKNVFEKEKYNIYSKKTTLSKTIQKFYRTHSSLIDNYMNNKWNNFEEVQFSELPMHSIGNTIMLLPIGLFDQKSLIKSLIIQALSVLNEDNRSENYRDNIFYIEEFTRKCFDFYETDLDEYLSIYINDLRDQDFFDDIFRFFIYAADERNNPDRFWHIWNSFFTKIVNIFTAPDTRKNSKILKSYIFNSIRWNANSKEWHSFRECDKNFFNKITIKLYMFEELVDYISYLMYGIASNYLSEGISWLAQIIKKDSFIRSYKVDISYLEHIIKEYIYKNLTEIRTNGIRKQEVCILLDYLIKKGSVTGYMLKDYIL